MGYKDPAKQREYQRLYVAGRRAAWFADKRCVRCDGTDRLELHHRKPAEKTHHAIWSWSEPRRLEEIAKCDVLCRACHTGLHQLQREQHGTRSRYKLGCRCDLCVWAYRLSEQRYRENRKRREAAA